MPEFTTTTMLAVFVATAALFGAMWIGVSWWLSRRREVLARRMRAPDSDTTIVLDDVLANRSWWQRANRQVQERLERADMGFTPPEALAIVLFCGSVLAAAVFFWRYEEDEAWQAIPAFIIGAAIPLVFFWWRQRVWRRKLQEQLPDMIFLLARSLRAGMSMDQSIRVLGEHGVAPLSREFARMHRQLDLGLALPQVLQTSADRIRLVDFSVFASVLSLHRATGGNLPVIMDRLAHTTREHNQMRGHYRTATALGRVSNIIIVVLVCVMLFYLWFFQRDLANHYFETAAGLTMFAVAMALELIGMGLLFYFWQKEEV
jgi:tight adherence protein B